MVMCLVIVNWADQVAVPAGTVTVSPSDAFATAAATFASWVSTAGHVAAYISAGTMTGKTMTPKMTELLLNVESVVRKVGGQYFICVCSYSRQLLVECLPRLGQAPREQRCPGPI